MAKIRRRDFRKKEHHSLHVNIRLQITSDEKPTMDEAQEYFDEMHDTGRVPRGLKMAAIQWTHARGGTRGWIEGSVRDVFGGNFDQVMTDMIENGIQIGIDRVRRKKGVWEIEFALEY